MSKKQTRPNAPLRGARSVAANYAAAERFAFLRSNLQVLTIVVLFVVGIVALSPGANTWFQYRQQIADYQQQVAQAKADLAKMKVERKRWSDPIYIRSQARDRLYYVLPGEISYLVMNADGISSSDVSGTVGAKLAAERATTKISSTITAAKKNWVNSLMQTVVRAGIDEPTTKK